MNNCELAAFCWLSNDSNSGLVNLTNMLIHTNVGWGIYLRGQSKTSNLPHILDNLHLENNGTSGSNVTVDGTSRDPQTIYLEKCFAKINGGFLAGNASGPQIKLVNARLGVDGLKMGGGMSLSIFDADTDSIITLDNISILTGIFNTEATIEWGQGNQVSASSGTSQVVGSRIPKDNIKYLAIPDNSMTDPSFEYGIGNIGGSSSNNPTITSSSDQTIIGARSLKAVYKRFKFVSITF